MRNIFTHMLWFFFRPMNHIAQIRHDIEIFNKLFQTIGRWRARINFELSFSNTCLAELFKVFLIL